MSNRSGIYGFSKHPITAYGVLSCMLFLYGCMAQSTSSTEQSSNTSEQLFLSAWHAYKSAFIAQDGRLIDSYHKISHSEGQGTAMLFAVVADDRPLFHTLWTWTQAQMQREDQLFSWRWDEASTPHITDYNNASDGDILIAWALAKAHQRWGEPGYLSEARKIISAIKTHLVVDHAGYSVLLPGSFFFKTDEQLTLNFSYFILPAFEAFSEMDDYAFWEKVYDDSLRLNRLIQRSEFSVAPDWVNLSKEGVLSVSEQHGAAVGYDAIRVPLYLAWQGHQSELKAYRDLWAIQGGWRTAPSKVDLLTGEATKYPPEAGFLTIRALSYPEGSEALLRPYAVKDYFSSSLVLFSLLSTMGF